MDPQEKQSDGSTSGPQLPPHSVTIKTPVKKEEPDEENGKGIDEGEDGPCTKMTMRLRRNLNNPQCVSGVTDNSWWQLRFNIKPNARLRQQPS